MAWLTSFISLARDERVILIGIGLTSFAVVRSMITALTLIRDDSAIPPSLPKSRYITQETEDSLQLDTLGKLLEHPSYAITEVATKILCERAVNSEDAMEILLRGITRRNYDERLKSLRALALLTGQTTSYEGLSKLNHSKAYACLVRSLELSLGDVEHGKLENYHWDEYYLRDMAERFCLMLVLELMNKYGSTMLVKAKIVEKWLAKQNWGDDADERQRNFYYYMRFKSNRIVDIVNHVKRSRRGIRALEKSGLIPSEYVTQKVGEFPEVLMEFEPVPSGGGVSLDHQAPRAWEQSVEEQRLRRQHREAMVLNDGTRPFGRDDIIERGHDSAN